MKKIAVFICSTQDTVTCDDLEKYEANKCYMELPEILDLIRIKSGADEMIFSLINGARENTLLDLIKKLNPYFEGTKISFGLNFSSKHGFNENGDQILSLVNSDKLYKVETIIYYIGLLKEIYEITWIGFADDTFCKFPESKRRLTEAFPDIEIQTFCPHEIDMVNKELINYLGVDKNTIDENLPSESEWLDFNNPKVKVKDVTKL